MIKAVDKNFIWNLIGTTFNAFNSLFFLIIVTRLIGIREAGIFTTCFSLACLLCIIATYCGRVFHVTDIKNSLNNKEYIIHRVITCILMLIITCIYMWIKDYSTYNAIILILLSLYKCFEAFAEVFYGILQRNDQLYKVGISLTIKSILSLIVFTIISYITKNLIISCILINVIWILITIIYDIPNSIKHFDIKEKVSITRIFNFFKIAFFTFAFSFLSVYVVNLPKYLLDGRMSEDIQAIFGIILMPATIMILLSQYILSPFVKKMTDAIINKDKNSFKKLINNLIYVFLGLGFIIIVLMLLCGNKIMGLIYNINLTKYNLEIISVLVGALCYGISLIYSAGLTALRYTFIQFIIYLICSVVGTVFTLSIISSNNVIYPTVAYLFVMILQLLMYMVTYMYIIKKNNNLEVK